jgi:hypothetical protein
MARARVVAVEWRWWLSGGGSRLAVAMAVEVARSVAVDRMMVTATAALEGTEKNQPNLD